MEKKNNRNSHIMMNKGMKQKVSVLLIACLLLTGYHGLTISGKAEQTSKSESNEISVSGTEVRVQLLGEDLRRAAREAVEKGTKVEGSFPEGYSGDGELQKEYEAIFSPEKEVYEIPLDSISEGLSESLSEEEAGLQIFVERDAKDLESLVRKESTESLLLYDGSSQLAQLFPERKKEEKQNKTEKAKELTEGAVASSSDIEETAVASDSNIERRNTELTGSELITFLYKNKSEHKISFKLSVDGNQYPKLVVAPKAQLFKGLVEKLKKEEKKAPAEVKPAEKQEEKPAEHEEEQAKEEPVKAEASEEKKQLAEENAPVEEKKELSKKEEKPVSEVSIVSTEGKAEEAQPEAKEVEEKTEKREEQKEDKVETAEAESKEESAEKGVEAEKDGAKSAEAEKEAANTEKQADEKGRFEGFLQEVIDHYEEFLAELSSARFRRYSLNELGRKTQNVEIKDFVTVEVFYEDEAFDEEVVLEAKRLLKPEEEKEGEKLTEEQVEAMKGQAIYDDSASLDIRFVAKKEASREVEPKKPVSVRLSLDKRVLPENVSENDIAIHHLVEDKNRGVVEFVETLVRSENEKNAKKNLDSSDVVDENIEDNEDTDNKTVSKDESKITKEFVVNSFSPYIIAWNDWNSVRYHGVRVYYVDRNGREIGPTRYFRYDKTGNTINGSNYVYYYEKGKEFSSILYAYFDNYKLDNLYGVHEGSEGGLYNGYSAGVVVKQLTNRDFTWHYRDASTSTTTNFGQGCAYHDFVFVYEFCETTRKSYSDKSEIELRNEKYITDRQDGTYDLTLTGQIKQDKAKQKLDIVFVYDNTDIMATDFNFDGNLVNTEGSYAGKADRKSTKVKKELKSFMEKMSALSSSYDTRYALVTMDGDKEISYTTAYKTKYSDRYKDGYLVGWEKDNVNTYNEYNASFRKVGYKPGETTEKHHWFPIIRYDDLNYQNYKYLKGDKNIVGELQGGTAGNPIGLDRSDPAGSSIGFTVSDEAENDSKHVHKFTSDPADILSMLDALNEERKGNNISGENYEAAIRNVKALLRQRDALWRNGGWTQRTASLQAEDISSKGDLSRDNAKRIVIFIAGGDPKYSYVKKEFFNKNNSWDDWAEDKGSLDDLLRLNNNEYYLTRGEYKLGYSIGNGRTIDFAALNQARGELHTLTNVDAFYSIGVGKKTNWNYLRDFAMGQADAGDAHKDRRFRALAEGVEYKDLDGSTKEKLESSFNQILEGFKSTANQVKNIEIQDVLTQYVELVNGDASLSAQLVELEEDGVRVKKVLEPNEMRDLGLNGFKLRSSWGNYSPKGQNRRTIYLETNPVDFALKPGYEIRLIANVKPTQDAFNEYKKATPTLFIGQERTDLNDIYNKYLGIDYPVKQGEYAEMFNTSAGKVGLRTNEEAKIKYIPKKPNIPETPTEKEYLRPIFRPAVDLTINKKLFGLGNNFYQGNELTEIGKKILKQITFNIYREDLGEQKHLLTINLGDDRFAGKPGTYSIDGYSIEVSTIQTSSTESELSVTIKNLPPNRRYKVVEEEINRNTVISNSTGTKAYSFDKKVVNSTKTEDWNSMPYSRTIGFKNHYIPATPKKTITINKIVEEFGDTAHSPEATNKPFDFYIGLYRYNGSEYVPLSDTETATIVNNWKAEHPGDKRIGGYKDKIPVPVGNNKTVMQYLPRVSLKHRESISLNLDTNLYYRILESKDKGYDVAKAEKKTLPTTVTIQKVRINDCDYSITEIFNQGDEFTFRNPRQTIVPTGLRGDITPYLFSIFGFTMMAGIYLTIKKKKRLEI